MFFLILSLNLFFNQKNVFGHQQINPQTTVDAPTESLKYLADLYEINLTPAEIEIVANNCSSIIRDNIFNLSIQLRESLKQYEELFLATKRSLVFIDNNLTQIAQDTTAINSLQQDLIQLETSFLSSVEQYKLSLFNLSSLVDNCQLQPEGFLAGLKNMQQQRLLVISDSDNFLNFLQTDFTKILIQTKTGLKD